jgi:hypothetical protein
MTTPPLAVDLPARPPASQVRQRSVDELLAPKLRANFPMRGFDPEFADIVDYIFKITHRIWAERAVGQIYDYYDHACVVYTPFEVTRSVEDVVNGTIGMMQSFPDRESRFINVAWSGDDEQGYYTSHLGFSQMTNVGPSVFGPATGRKVKIHHIADCVSRDNRIFLEWLVRDNGALVRQLGLDPYAVARNFAGGMRRLAVAHGSSACQSARPGRRSPGPCHGRTTPWRSTSRISSTMSGTVAVSTG